MNMSSDLKIAVAGGGVAGIVAAWLLQRRHRVILFEKNEYLGGHTHTVDVKDGSRSIPVDTGFIVFNDRTYPNFIRFIGQLGVSCQKSPMSFSYNDARTGFTYSSSALFADPKNRLNFRFWMLLAEILRFNLLTRRLLASGGLRGLSLGSYLRRYRFSPGFAEQYMFPMGSAIWSTPDRDMERFPAETFARFADNHGLLSIVRHPQWYTIKGGSRNYVRAFLERFKGRVLTGEPVRSIARENGRVRVFTDTGEEEFDAVVIASHADEALQMLSDPTPREAALLSRWRYTSNRTVLHTDENCLPQLERARASWNYIREADQHKTPVLTMTYYMNLLQRLPGRTHFCVSLNPGREIDKSRVKEEMIYTHPLFTADALAAQPGLQALNGNNNTYYCGSYHRYGFHEDAVMSAVAVGEKFGLYL